MPIIVSTHPRTKKRLEELSFNQQLETSNLIKFLKPFGFSDYVHLQQKALCTLSDSGTISEESAMLNFPAISLRQSMERPEAQDAGTIILTGFEPEIVLSSIRTVIEEHNNRTQMTQIQQINTDKNISENLFYQRYLRSIQIKKYEPVMQKIIKTTKLFMLTTIKTQQDLIFLCL